MTSFEQRNLTYVLLIFKYKEHLRLIQLCKSAWTLISSSSPKKVVSIYTKEECVYVCNVITSEPLIRQKNRKLHRIC